ncbi:glycerophosphodiester phosphodiesterase [Chamaesiphon sp. VAR_69_metabat_338]|uniref:glycerophosphodiester phosphodiesterase n=1 Tax=Chamaesiphon sp. VAR_69_metabat_338 TaxID=2964704 RepID=UPI00286D9EAC|nr:glycerophosphodiester phosphodiesterase [Chamaesiphon sp. VAR_69_metabat_338]
MNRLHRISLSQPRHISIVAHRGNTAQVKSENTIEAFSAAMSILGECNTHSGIPQIEFDLRLSRDGYVIIYHDRTIDGMEVSDLDYPQLQSMAQSKGFEIPLFEDLLKLCRDFVPAPLQRRIALDIEIKEEGYEERVIALATQYLSYDNFVIKSFNDASVRKIKDLDPQIKVGLLLGKVTGKFPLLSILTQFFPEYRIIKTGADFVAPHFRLLRFGFLWRMKLMNIEVFVWTVNEERRLVKLLKSKYIAAVITDRPELALAIVARLDRSKSLNQPKVRRLPAR